MKKLRSNAFAKVLSFIAAALFVLPINAGSVFAKEEIKATTRVKHKPPKYFVSEKRIEVEADVTDKGGVNLVRCYFRAEDQADYLFVTMNPGSSLYKGILPAPSKETETLEYLFLVVNGNNQVVKTQKFEVNRDDGKEAGAWQQVSPEGDIHVSTELAQAPSAPAGFSDSIVVDVVESAARFGTVAGGIYLASESGDVSGAAAATISGGTVTASAGMSTLAIAGLAAAVAGAGAAAAGGGGHDEGSEPVQPHEWTSYSIPADPSPGQNVTVVVDVNASGAQVHWEWVGTDLWNDSGISTSGSNGEIRFTIPGAAEGVTDTVTVSVPDWGPTFVRTFSYTF